jgi:hypothetical protein
MRSPITGRAHARVDARTAAGLAARDCAHDASALSGGARSVVLVDNGARCVAHEACRARIEAYPLLSMNSTNPNLRSETAASDALRTELKDAQVWFMTRVPRLERMVWERARGAPARGSVTMLRVVLHFIEELSRHLRVADGIVFPTHGGGSGMRALALEHLDAQAGVSEALAKATAGTPSPEILAELAVMRERLQPYFDTERRFLGVGAQESPVPQ